MLLCPLCFFPAFLVYVNLVIPPPRQQAAQEVNVHQVATTAVSIGVFVRSDHKPEFPSPLYEGVITDVGVMAKNKNDMGQLLRITATDADYDEVRPSLKSLLSLSVDTNCLCSLVSAKQPCGFITLTYHF